MANNKIFIGIIIGLAIVVLGLLGYYVILPNINQGQSAQGGISAGGNLAGGITEAHFEVFPAGTQIRQGMTGTNTNTFNKDDLVSISGQSDVNKEMTLTLKILDSNGNSVSNTGWYGNEIKIKLGTFGFGSIVIPQTTGTYVLKIFLNNQEAKDMPFTIE